MTEANNDQLASLRQAAKEGAADQAGIQELQKKLEEAAKGSDDQHPDTRRLEAQASDPVLTLIEDFWAKLRAGELTDQITISRTDLQALIMDNQKQRRSAEAETGPLSAGEMLSVAHDRGAGFLDAMVATTRGLLDQVRWLTNVVNACGVLDGPDYVGTGKQVNEIRKALLEAKILENEDAFLYRRELRKDGEEGSEEEGAVDGADEGRELPEEEAQAEPGQSS